MPRPSQPTRVGARPVLSADDLLKANSLRPIIASRDAASLRLEYTRPRNEQRKPNVDADIDDYDDDSLYATQRRSYVQYSRERTQPNFTGRQKHMPRLYRETKESRNKVYPLFVSPSPRDPRLLHWRKSQDKQRASPFYISLKVLEMVSLSVVMVILYVAKDAAYEEHFLTFCCVSGILLAALALLLLWNKRLPVPRDRLHIAIFVLYNALIPLIICGVFLILLSNHDFKQALAALLIWVLLLCVVDVLIISSAIFHWPCKGVLAHYIKSGASAHYPKISASAQYPKTGASAHYPKTGASAHYPKISASAHYPKTGASAHYPKTGASAHYPKIHSTQWSEYNSSPSYRHASNDHWRYKHVESSPVSVYHPNSVTL